jgi:ubiquinone/menaquinone biosynthesis C-methylase UbiE
VIKLNLGCGDKILEGYVNVDVVNERAGKSPDVVCDIKKLDKFDSNYADEVMAIHVVEHFDRWDIVEILREWSRVLKPGGKMILECPNLESACKEFLKDPINHSKPNQNGQRTMWVFYGDPSWRDPLMMHKWGYTPRSLAQVMHEAGLMDLKQEPAQYKLREPRDMRVTGLKPGP